MFTLPRQRNPYHDQQHQPAVNDHCNPTMFQIRWLIKNGRVYWPALAQQWIVPHFSCDGLHNHRKHLTRTTAPIPRWTCPTKPNFMHHIWNYLRWSRYKVPSALVFKILASKYGQHTSSGDLKGRSGGQRPPVHAKSGMMHIIKLQATLIASLAPAIAPWLHPLVTMPTYEV